MNRKLLKKRLIILTSVLSLCLSAGLVLNWDKTDSQTKITYIEIITALNSKVPNSVFKNKTEVITFLIKDIKARKVDEPLTEEVEKLLRKAGATNGLIDVIRQNSPPLPTPTPTRTTSTSNAKTITNSIGMEFVKIPSGSFMMGSDDAERQEALKVAKRYTESASLDWFKDEGPRRRVTIDYEFYLGKFEVTQAEYEKVMGTNPSNFKNCPRCPVEQVSWDDAKEFIKKLNARDDDYEYRLPSEAEWEYAARAGTTTAFGIGDGNNLSSNEANFDGNYPYGNASKGTYLQKTVKVGSYNSNKWGLYDMHGNVWEWCEDIYQDNYSGLPVDGSANVSRGDSSKRVLRGGSWVNSGGNLRSASRVGGSPSLRLSSFGFRLAFRPSAS